MTNDLTVHTEPQYRLAPPPALDKDRFGLMHQLATIMAHSSLIPDSLCAVRDPRTKELVRLPDEVVVANCFLIVNQSDRWGLDPFAVAQCVSVVHGRLCYEGKLVAGVMEAKLGIQLNYEFGIWKDNQTNLKAVGTGDMLAVRVSERLSNGQLGRFIDGSVGNWKTSGNNTPWGNPANHRRQLRYRGAREWARAHEPALMLGVYTDDEMMEVAIQTRAERAKELEKPSLTERLAGPDKVETDDGFDHDHVKSEITNGRDKPKERPVEAVEDQVDPETGEIDNGDPGPAVEETDAIDAEAEAASEPETLGREVFEGYSAALIRFNDADKLRKGAMAYWKQHGGWPTPNPTDLALGKMIYAAHGNRIDGKISPEDTALHVLDLINDAFDAGEPELAFEEDDL